MLDLTSCAGAEVEVRFERTPLRAAAEMVSAFAALVTVAWALVLRRVR